MNPNLAVSDVHSTFISFVISFRNYIDMFYHIIYDFSIYTLFFPQKPHVCINFGVASSELENNNF